MTMEGPGHQIPSNLKKISGSKLQWLPIWSWCGHVMVSQGTNVCFPTLTPQNFNQPVRNLAIQLQCRNRKQTRSTNECPFATIISTQCKIQGYAAEKVKSGFLLPIDHVGMPPIASLAQSPILSHSLMIKAADQASKANHCVALTNQDSRMHIDRGRGVLPKGFISNRRFNSL